MNDRRRITDPQGAGPRDLLTLQHLDNRLLVLGRNGRLTLSLDALREALGLEAIAAQAAADVPAFEGAGADGLVPDPVSETGLFLKDDGTWAAPAGGGGAGTAFPTSPTPVDGQWFYRTDHRTLYVRDATAAVWLSVQIHEVPYGQTAAVATNGFFKVGGSNGSAQFSANFGHLFGFPVAIVGISWRSVGPSSGTVAVFANNAAIASATMLLVSDTAKTREDFLPAAGATANQTIQVKNTGSATAATTAQGVIRFRRRET